MALLEHNLLSHLQIFKVGWIMMSKYGYLMLPGASYEKALLWKVVRLPVFQFLVLHQFLYQQISFLQLSRISLNIWKKFSSQIIFFKQIHPLAPTPSPYWPKSAKRDKSFLSIFPKISDEISFFQTFIDKILQSIF